METPDPARRPMELMGTHAFVFALTTQEHSWTHRRTQRLSAANERPRLPNPLTYKKAWILRNFASQLRMVATDQSLPRQLLSILVAASSTAAAAASISGRADTLLGKTLGGCHQW